MKIIVRIMSLLMTGVLMVGLLTSCSKNSLRPHDALPPIKPLFMHVGYVGSTSASYAKYTDNDIQKLTDIGVNEVCIAYGTAPVTYIPEGGTEPELLITKDDINAITADMVGGNPSQADLDNLKAQYRSKINPLDEDLLLNDYADMTLEFAERLVAINPDIEIWYSFPDMYVVTLADLYIEPCLEYYDYLKNNTDPQIWENNIKGFYWLKEDVPTTTYNCFETDNLVDFNNAEVRAMKACNDAVHEDGKLTFWCPYYRATDDTGKHIGFIANQTDIFDYVILQPNHVFSPGLDYNIDLIKEITLQNAVLNKNYVVWGGEKKSSTMVGAEMESQSNLFSGSDREENLEKYQDYVNAYQDFVDKYPIALYYGERNGVMSDIVFNQLKDFLAGTAKTADSGN